jgi:hypothetical protein
MNLLAFWSCFNPRTSPGPAGKLINIYLNGVLENFAYQVNQYFERPLIFRLLSIISELFSFVKKI